MISCSSGDPSHKNALRSCGQLVQQYGELSGFPGYQKSWGNESDPEYHFSWGKGDVSENQSLSAYCAVNKSSGKVSALTINSKTIF